MTNPHSYIHIVWNVRQVNVTRQCGLQQPLTCTSRERRIVTAVKRSERGALGTCLWIAPSTFKIGKKIPRLSAKNFLFCVPVIKAVCQYSLSSFWALGTSVANEIVLLFMFSSPGSANIADKERKNISLKYPNFSTFCSSCTWSQHGLQCCVKVSITKSLSSGKLFLIPLVIVLIGCLMLDASGRLYLPYRSSTWIAEGTIWQVFRMCPSLYGIRSALFHQPEL